MVKSRRTSYAAPAGQRRPLQRTVSPGLGAAPLAAGCVRAGDAAGRCAAGTLRAGGLLGDGDMGAIPVSACTAAAAACAAAALRSVAGASGAAYAELAPISLLDLSGGAAAPLPSCGLPSVLYLRTNHVRSARISSTAPRKCCSFAGASEAQGYTRKGLHCMLEFMQQQGKGVSARTAAV